MNKNKKNGDGFRRPGIRLPPLIALALTLLMGLLLTACTKVEVTPPAYELKLSESRQLHAGYGRVWARAIGWFDANELAIERIDEKTGFIEGRLPLPDDSSFLDCGTVKLRNVIGKPKMEKAGRVRMIVRGRSAPTASVTIFTTGAYKLSVKDPYAGRDVYRSGPCTSNGELEQQIFAFLNS